MSAENESFENKFHIEERLRYARMTEEKQALLANFWPVVEARMPELVEAFFAHVSAVPKLADIVAKHDYARLQDMLRNHLMRLFNTQINEEHIHAVYRIGAAHVRIGLEPRWYVASYQLILSILHKFALHHYRWRPWRVMPVIEAMNIIIMLDMDLAMWAYQDGMARDRHEQAKAKALQDAEINRCVSETGKALAAVARGDLTYRITEKFAGQLAKIGDDFNSAVNHMENSLRTIRAVLNTIRTSARDRSQSADDLARRTEQQAAGLQQASSALDEMTHSVRNTSEDVTEASNNAKSAKHAAEHGCVVMNTAIDAMARIEHSSKEISDITGVIDEIAFQTNLLALNAGVEAARAGESGRGFVVVASEVRALAQRSREAAQNIKKLIRESGAHVASGVHHVGETSGALTNIVEEIGRIDKLIAAIAQTAVMQLSSLQEINEAVADIDRATQENAAIGEESNAAMLVMAEDTDRLNKIISTFTVSRSMGG